MKTFEDYGLRVGEVAPQSPTDNPVDLAVATYASLGLVSDEGRARETFGLEIDKLTDSLPAEVKDSPHDPLIVPKLGALTLTDFIDRYDTLTASKGNNATYVWYELWDQYTPDELNQGQIELIGAQAVLLEADNDYDEPGLYLTSQDLTQQRDSLKLAQTEHSNENSETKLHTVSPASYIIRNAMQLERGQLLQDQETFTRFIELEDKSAFGASYVPSADSDDGQVGLFGSYGHASSYAGVRLSVGLK